MFHARRGAAPSKRRPWRRLKFPIKLYQVLIKSMCRECPNYSQHTSNGAFGEMESKRSEDSNSETLSRPDKIWLRSEDNTILLWQLGPGFALGDYEWIHSPEKLAKVFPPPIASKGPNESRTNYLKRRGQEPWIASVRTPPGWFTDMHLDLASAQRTGGLEVLHVVEPCTFILLPFCIHAVIAFEHSSHTVVTFAHTAHWDVAREGLEFLRGLVRNSDHPATSVVEVAEKVVHETPIWHRAMGEDGVAATYLLCSCTQPTRYSGSRPSGTSRVTSRNGFLRNEGLLSVSRLSDFDSLHSLRLRKCSPRVQY
ncbi:hypothetical protein B0H16DRAFT_1703323, partial [Mycena metata]